MEMKRFLSAALTIALLLTGNTALAGVIGGAKTESTPEPQENRIRTLGGSEQEENKGKTLGGSLTQSSTLNTLGGTLSKSGHSATSSAGTSNAGTSAQMQAADQPQTAPAQQESAPVQADGDMDALRETWLSKDQYYYQQLSDAHKAAWTIDIENVLHYPDQTQAGTQDLRNQALASMIKTDNPRIFWIDWIDSRGLLRFETGSVATYAALQFPDGQTLETLRETFLAGIDAAVADIARNLSADADARTKAKAIHDWLCRNNVYNDAQTSSHKKESDPVSFAYLAAHSAYSAIIPGDAYEPVCEGYANAFKILCEELGVTCICVNGSTSFASAHRWNYVQLEDGKWYLVDVTSDDAGNGNDSYYHTYFMLTSSKSAQSAYTPSPYMNSGVNPSNGYTEGAAFTVPELAEK